MKRKVKLSNKAKAALSMSMIIATTSITPVMAAPSSNRGEQSNNLADDYANGEDDYVYNEDDYGIGTISLITWEIIQTMYDNSDAFVASDSHSGWTDGTGDANGSMLYIDNIPDEISMDEGIGSRAGDGHDIIVRYEGYNSDNWETSGDRYLAGVGYWESKTFTESVDYSVSIVDNDVPGMATVTITFLGLANNSGDMPYGTVTFEVPVVASLAGADVKFTNANQGTGNQYTYTGSAITPTLEVKIGSAILDLGDGTDGDYNYRITSTDDAVKGTSAGINAGEVAIEIFPATNDLTSTGTDITDGTVTGSTTATFEIVGADLATQGYKIWINSGEESQQYDGSDKTPAFIVAKESDVTAGTADASTTLTLNTHYTVAYSNNVDIADSTDPTAPPTITVTGTGNYSGDLTAKFSITEDLTDAGLLASYTYAYSNTTGGDGLSSATPYTVGYTGGIIDPELTVTFNNGSDTKELEEGVDYKVEYSQSSISFASGSLVVTTLDYLKNAGTGSAKITFLGNHLNTDAAVTTAGNGNEGGVTHVFKVEANLTDAIIKTVDSDGNSQTSFTYTNAGARPNLLVTYNGATLTAAEYTISVPASYDVGRQSVLVSGNTSNGWSGSQTIEYDIISQSIATGSIGTIADQDFTGSAVEPEIVVKDKDGATLTKGTDYEVVFAQNTSANKNSGGPISGSATPQVIVTGIGNYTGQLSGSFNIAASPSTPIAATIEDIADQVWTGVAVEPSDVVIKVDGKTLVKGSDYNLTYGTTNTNAGVDTAEVIIVGIGKYEGGFDTTGNNVADNTRKFSILYDDTGLTVDVANTNAAGSNNPFTGAEVKPTVTVKNTLSSAVDVTDLFDVNYSDNINAGTSAKITITPKATSTTVFSDVKLEKTFAIAQADIATGTVALSSTSMTYTGSEVKPTVTSVTGVTNVTTYSLTEGVDYEVTYNDNTVASAAAKVTVTGIGNFMGTKDTTFTITADADILKGSITTIPKQEYMGDAVEPDITVIAKGVPLEKGTDYTSTFSSNTVAGWGQVTVAGVANTAYASATPETASFQIWGQIDKADITLTSSGNTDANEWYYKGGSPIEPDVTLAFTGATIPAIDSDWYDVDYTSNTALGTATVTVTGKSDEYYEGRKTDTFKIIQTPITADVGQVTTSGILDADNNELEFDYDGGNAVVLPDLKLVQGDYELIKDTDYTVKYTSNTEIGTANYTITALNSYTGTITGTFKINAIGNAVTANSVTLYEDEDLNNSAVSFAYEGVDVEPFVKVVLDSDSTVLTEGTHYDVVYSSNTDVGTGKVTITPATGGIYSFDTIEKEFKITGDLADATIEFTHDEIAYTGSAIDNTANPVKVLMGETVLSEDKYILTFSENINVGTSAKATITNTLSGGYTGTNSKTFTIVGKDIDDVTVATIPAQQFTGSDIEPTVVVTDGSTTLSLGTDYTVSYDDNVSVGTGTVTIKGVSGSNYDENSTKEVTFEIGASAIDIANGFEVSIELDDQAYTGKEITPSIADATVSGKNVELGTHYTLSYENNLEPGTAKVILNGIDDYTGVKGEVEFNIVGDISKTGLFSISGTDQIYTGSVFSETAIAPEITSKTGGAVVNTAVSPVSSGYTFETTSTEAGTGKITVTATEDNEYYTGSRTLSFKIGQKDIGSTATSKATIATISSQAYLGSAVKPTLEVSYGSDNLTLGTDYTVSYSGNTGKTEDGSPATAKVTFKGNYTGTAEATFAITDAADAADAASFRISKTNAALDTIGTKTYTGAEINPTFTVYDNNGTTLKAGTDYEFAYNDGDSDYTNPGTHKMTIKAIDDSLYDGVANFDVTFDIVAPLSSSKLSFKIESIPYYDGIDLTATDLDFNDDGTGKEINLVALLNDGTTSLSINGNECEAATDDSEDFILTLSKDINAVGSRTVTIKPATGNTYYTGSKTVTFTVSQVDLESERIDLADIIAQTYTGSAIKPEVTITDEGPEGGGDYELTTSDYTISYSNNTAVGRGTATVTIKGKNNYTGTITKNFDIVMSQDNGMNELKTKTGDLKLSDQTYTGNDIKPTTTITNGSGTTLKAGTDFEYVYNNDDEFGEDATEGLSDLGSYEIKVVGMGNYETAASITLTYDIKVPLSNSKLSYTLNETNVEYKGTAFGETDIFLDSVTLTGMGELIDTDFKDGLELTFVTNYDTNAGTGKITVTPAADSYFTGSKSLTYTIGARKFESPSDEDSEFELKLEGEDWDGYVANFTGSAIKPTVTLLDNGLEVPSSNYTVTYANNTNIGTNASISIVGKTNYSGVINATFEIKAKEAGEGESPYEITINSKDTTNDDYTTTAMSGNTFSYTASKGTYLTNYTPSVVVKVAQDVNGKSTTTTLKQNTDYEVTYPAYNKPGKLEVVVKGMGNYASILDEHTLIHDIKGSIALGATTITSEIADKAYAGGEEVKMTDEEAEAFAVKFLCVDGVEIDLVEDEDYTLDYSNNTSVGTAKITVTGMGQYTGSKSVTYKIVANDMTDFDSFEGDLTLDGYGNAEINEAGNSTTEYTYTGSAIKPIPVLKYTTEDGDTIELVSGTDYTIAYSNNTALSTDAKMGTVTLTGKGGFSGKLVINFKIVPQDSGLIISGSSLSAIANPAVKSSGGVSVTPVVYGWVNSKWTKLGSSYYTVKYTQGGKEVSLSEIDDSGEVKVEVFGAGNYLNTSADASKNYDTTTFTPY